MHMHITLIIGKILSILGSGLHECTFICMFTHVHSSILTFSKVHWCTLTFTHVHSYTCSLMYTHVHWCLLIYTQVHSCSLMFTYVLTLIKLMYLHVLSHSLVMILLCHCTVFHCSYNSCTITRSFHDVHFVHWPWCTDKVPWNCGLTSCYICDCTLTHTVCVQLSIGLEP